MDYYSNAATDNFRIARSKFMEAPEDGTYGVIRMPNKAFLVEVWFNLLAPFNTGSTAEITIGIRGNKLPDNPDGVMDSSLIDATAAGWYRASSGTSITSEGYWYNEASGDITITISRGDATNNMYGVVLAQYSVLF
jgi:hypothetical protein